MDKKRIVILNGPPGCGKDTIGGALLGIRSGCVLTSFKYDLYRVTAEHYRMELEELLRVAQDRELKEEVHPSLGVTPREALIHVSEDICKPRLGKGYFGVKALQRVESIKYLNEVIFTDGGFTEEVEVFLAAGYEVVIVQLHGRGSFEHDSRRYIEIDHPDCTIHKVQLVDGQVHQGVLSVMEALG